MNKEIPYWAGINKYFKLNIDWVLLAPAIQLVAELGTSEVWTTNGIAYASETANI